MDEKAIKKAKKLFDDGKTYKQISNAVGYSTRTIQGWKTKFDWQRSNQNKNIVNGGKSSGNRQAKAPPQNKNSTKTGEHETLLISTLSELEKEMYQSAFNNPLDKLKHEIKMLEIRQSRMLTRLDDAVASLDPDETKQYYQFKNGKKLLVNEEITFTNKMNLVLAIEEAMTRVSKQLTNSLKQYSEMENQQLKTDVIKLQKEKLEQEVKRMKMLNGDADVRQDDGFIDALKDLANDADVWTDADD